MTTRQTAFLQGYLSKSAGIGSSVLKAYGSAARKPIGLPPAAGKAFNRYMTGKDVAKAQKSVDAMRAKETQFDVSPSKRIGYGLANEKLKAILKSRQRARNVGRAGKAGVAAGGVTSQLKKEEPNKEISDNKQLQKESSLKTSIAKAYAAPKAALKLPGLRPEQKMDKFTKKYRKLAGARGFGGGLSLDRAAKPA